MAGQLTARNISSGAGPKTCSARATSSLPVPDSPVMSTVVQVGPTLRIMVFTVFITLLSPTRAPGSVWL